MAREAKQSNIWNYQVVSMRMPHPITGQPTGVFANIRADNNEILGITSEQYGIVQNCELLDMARAAFDKEGLAHAGEKIIVTEGGKRVFAEFDFGQKTAKTEVGDIFGYKLRMKNSFDRSVRAAVELFFKRLACKNGMATLLREFAMDKKHSKKITVDFVREAVEKAFAHGNEALHVFEVLGNKEIKMEQGQNILTNLGLSEKMREAIEQLWLNPRRPQDRARNLYNLYNAVTEHLTHQVEGDRYEYAMKTNHSVLATLHTAAVNKDEFKKLICKLEDPNKIVVRASGPVE
jgi:hypothetical protein